MRAPRMLADLPTEPDQRDGYLVVLKAELALARWRSEAGQGVAAYERALRAATPGVHPERYRGIQRDPIDRWWVGEPFSGLRLPNDQARRRIWDLLGPDPCADLAHPPRFDPDLLPTVEVAREILSLTDAPSDRELLRVSRDDLAPAPETLGFDVGDWGSGHASVVADAIVMPRWHPCPPDRLGSLAPWARDLDHHLLFPTAADAAAFRRWYVGQPWAREEREPGAFQVIRVDLAV